MSRRLFFLPLFLPLFLAIALPSLHAQTQTHFEGAADTTPEFATAVPFSQNGKDISVKYPVIVNSAAILKPGYIMRTMYIFQSAQNAGGDADPNLTVAHAGNKDMAYSRTTTSSVEAAKAQLTPAMMHELERYRRTVWTAPNNFILAMEQFPLDQLHLMYSPTGRDSDIEDARFQFFDGMLIGLPNGKVTVITVEKGSKAEKGGIKPGDELVAVGGIPLKGSLETFITTFSDTKKKASTNDDSSYPVTIRSAASGETYNADIPMSSGLIKNGLMHGI